MNVSKFEIYRKWLKTKMCQFDGCRKIAHYNFKGEQLGIFCREHQKGGMTRLDQLCIVPGCTTYKSFGIQGGKITHCLSHKTEEMVDLKSRKCLENGCNLQPVFNFKGEKKGIYCGSHKKEGMINLIAKICIAEGCTIQACYNFPGEKWEYCATHKSEGMICVKGKKCEYNGCTTCPFYGLKGTNKATHCGHHKSDQMIDLVTKKCRHDNCQKRACYSFEGTFAEYCNEHKSTGMINVTSKRCLTQGCNTLIANKYKGYCFICYMEKFPDEEKCKNFKVKEIAVKNFITEKFNSFEWICDKIVLGGKSKKRPDFLVRFKTHCVIVEVDENQHKIRHENDQSRTQQITDDLDTKVVFIRFNPDGYKTKEKNITSVWRSLDGEVAIMKTRRKEWNTRLEILGKSISKWTETIPNEKITVEKLFFDEI